MKLAGPAHYQSLEYDRIISLVGEWMASSPNKLRILDFGCGKGRYLRALTSLGADLTGVDANREYVSSAVAEGYDAVVADAFLDQCSYKFDVILVSHLIEHLRPDELLQLVPRLRSMLADGGRMIIVSPVPGERFWHDFSHVRPYLPQSIRHAFGQSDGPLVFGQRNILELMDIHFFRDPFRTRHWRSFYAKAGLARHLTRLINALSDLSWRLSGGRIGVTASWLGVYQCANCGNSGCSS